MQPLILLSDKKKILLPFNASPVYVSAQMPSSVYAIGQRNQASKPHILYSFRCAYALLTADYINFYCESSASTVKL